MRCARSLVIAVALVFVGCGGEEAPPPPVTAEDPGPALLGRAHAHNDYEHDRPLFDALDAGFHSVEADVWFADGKFEVSHYGIFPKGTLEGLYLQPLQERVDRDGTVQPTGMPFTLWVDLKDSDPGLVDALHALLDKYPMLTVFSDEPPHETPGAVTVVLTGNASMKEAFVSSRPTGRRAIRDSNDFSPEDPPADSRWGYYALSWGAYMDWNGKGDIPAAEADKLGQIVERAHELGRKVRFYGGPDRGEVWRAWIDHDVDFLHTDNLNGVARYLRLREERAPSE